MSFDLQQYLALSKPLDTSGIEWEAVANYPMATEEIRCLTYMMDIESHTIMYLRDLLNTQAVVDPDISAFLACWVYEESYHGRAIERFLACVGSPVEHDRVSAVRKGSAWKSTLDLVGTFVVSRLSRHFTGAYLTWGAINELTAMEGYRLLARRTGNPILAEILQRIIKDEARHFAFYYSQAEARLAERGAQRLTGFLLRRFWGPVGSSIKPQSDVAFLSNYLFDGESGRRSVDHIERTIRRLPGLEWFDLLGRACTQARAFAPTVQSTTTA